MKKWICLFLTVLLFASAVSCRSSNLKKDPDLPEEAEITAQIPDSIQQWIDKGLYDESIVDVFKATATPVIETTAVDRIEMAYREGSIDREHKALLMLQAAFDPDHLPEAYTGPVQSDGSGWIMSDLQWLILNFDQLDPTVQSAITPFICSPEEPASYFYPDQEDRPGILERLAGPLADSTVNAAEFTWQSWLIEIPGASREISLQYIMKGKTEKQQEEMDSKVQWVDEAFRKAWPIYRELLGNFPGQTIKIYLTPEVSESVSGYAYLAVENFQIKEYRIFLREALPEDKLKSVAAHELFHLFQYSMGLTWFTFNADLDWLMEATAVWAENHVYPGINREYRFLKEYSTSLSEDRLSMIGEREYGNYLLFLLMSDNMGKTESVADVLEAVSQLGKGGTPDKLKTVDVRGTIQRTIDNNVQNMTDVFYQFAVANWNQPPYVKYQDVDKSGQKIRIPFAPTGSSLQFIQYLNVKDVPSVGYSQKAGSELLTYPKGKYTESLSLNPGAIHYRLYLFPVSEQEIERVRFDFRESEMDPAPPPGANDMAHVRRLALIQINNQWQDQPEDWTDIEYRDFCRNTPEGKVTAVVLIYTYAKLDAKLPSLHTYVVDTEGKCSDYTGTIQMSWELPQQIESSKMTTQDSATFASAESLIYCPDCQAYVAAERTIDYRANRMTTNQYISDNGEFLGSSSYSRQEIGHVLDKYQEIDGPVIITISDDQTSVTIGDLFEISTTDWISVKTIQEENNFGVINRTENESQTSSPYCDFYDVRSEPMTLGSRSYQLFGSAYQDQLEISTGRIFGKRIVEAADGSTLTLEFEFIRQGS